jgi:thiamine-monophosphate kinase
MSQGHPPPGAGEFELIAWLRQQAAASSHVPIGIGDDCAIVRSTTGADLLVTTDMLLDGRHFVLGDCGPETAGYKSLAVNLSDIAAMAGRPLAAFVAVALPRGQAVAIAEGLFRGMQPLAGRFGVVLAGGDTNAWDGPLVVSVTVIGEVVAPGPVLRRGARPGDAVFVTGPLGGSLLGRHLRPSPRVEEARAIHQRFRITAMIDISDGLSSDLGHLIEEGGPIGAVLDPDAIPIHDDARSLAERDGRSPLDHALNDGEDFELCLTVAPDDADRLQASPPEGVALHRVGTIVAAPGLFLRDGARLVPIRPRGFDHLAGT